MAAARHDWVLALDADERVTPALRDGDRGAARARASRTPGYRIPRVAFYLGRWIRGTDWYPDPQLRLFDRRRGRWEGGLVHESVRVDGPRGTPARASSSTTPTTTSADHLATIDRYTTLWARQARAEGRRAGPLDGCVGPSWAFIRNYVVRRGVPAGRGGPHRLRP